MHFVTDLFPQGTPDPVIAQMGDEKGWIVVTWNHKDFKRLAARVPTEGQRVLRSLGRISFRCPENRGVERIRANIERVEFEYELSLRSTDRRLLIEISDSRFTVIR